MLLSTLLAPSKPLYVRGWNSGEDMLFQIHRQCPLGLFANLPSGPLYTVLPPYDSILYGTPQSQSIVVIPLKKRFFFPTQKETPRFLSLFLSSAECESLWKFGFFLFEYENSFSNSKRSGSISREEIEELAETWDSNWVGGSPVRGR